MVINFPSLGGKKAPFFHYPSIIYWLVGINNQNSASSLSVRWPFSSSTCEPSGFGHYRYQIHRSRTNLQNYLYFVLLLAMDESWRMRMGMPILPKRRSKAAEEVSTSVVSRRNPFIDSDCLAPDDFDDVFGGPPRSLLIRKFSGEFTNPDYFYQEIFHKSDQGIPENKIGRKLPEFRIPSSKVVEEHSEFYSDIFGSTGFRGLRSRSATNSIAKSKSMSNSSSVLSSEDLSPFRPIVREEVGRPSFAPKLRWNSSTSASVRHHANSGLPAFEDRPISHVRDDYLTENMQNECFRSSNFQFPRRLPSPVIISPRSMSRSSIRMSMDDVGLQSPPSAVSVLCQGPAVESFFQANNVVSPAESHTEVEEDEVMSSYVIDIDSRHKEDSREAADVDEAIAWAKEKFQASNSESDSSMRQLDGPQFAGTEAGCNAANVATRPAQGCEIDQVPEETGTEKLIAVEESRPSEDEMQMWLEALDENIRLWSAGKEANIRSLLSTLHHILKPSSGWTPVSLTNLIQSSQVKKTYQKVRLCLHPEKLQQKGATPPEKYVAERAFSILQDAWVAFISQDIVFG